MGLIERVAELSIVIVNWNTARLLRQCLASLAASRSDGRTEVVVVDNASSDGSAEMVEREFPGARLIRNERNEGFARANNQGIAASGGRYVLLLNSDTVVPAGAPGDLVRFMEGHPEAGVVGPRLLRPDGTPQPYAFGGDPTLRYLLTRGLNRLLFRRYLHDWNSDRIQEVDWVSGACLMARRTAAEQVGPLDEKIFMYFEDDDWCLRMRRRGWKVYYNPRVSITHVGGQSLVQNPAARQAYYRSLRYFYTKHYAPPAGWLLSAGLAIYRLMARR